MTMTESGIEYGQRTDDGDSAHDNDAHIMITS